VGGARLEAAATAVQGRRAFVILDEAQNTTSEQR